MYIKGNRQCDYTYNGTNRKPDKSPYSVVPLNRNRINCIRLQARYPHQRRGSTAQSVITVELQQMITRTPAILHSIYSSVSTSIVPCRTVNVNVRRSRLFWSSFAANRHDLSSGAECLAYEYVYATVPNTNHSMAPRTEECIPLMPTGDRIGSSRGRS